MEIYLDKINFGTWDDNYKNYAEKNVKLLDLMKKLNAEEKEKFFDAEHVLEKLIVKYLNTIEREKK